MSELSHHLHELESRVEGLAALLDQTDYELRDLKRFNCDNNYVVDEKFIEDIQAIIDRLRPDIEEAYNKTNEAFTRWDNGEDISDMSESETTSPPRP